MASPWYPGVTAFPAWVWMGPDARAVVRGLSTAELYVLPDRRIIVVPNAVGSSVGIPRIDYAWPAVVVERLVWSRRVNFPGLLNVLVDVDGRLRSVNVRRGGSGRLTKALSRAGFGVVEVTHVGWEGPAKVTAEELGDKRTQVPPSLMSNPWRPR